MSRTPRLLVATSKKLILWADAPRIIQKGRGLYYGITWSGQFIYVVSRTSQPHRVQVFDDQLKAIGHVPFKGMGLDPHQALYYDGILYVANRDKFCIQCWDFTTDKEYSVAVSDTDNHINSIWRHRDNFWVAEHRQDRMPKVIRVYNLQWEQIGAFSLYLKPQGRGYGIHNVYVEGNNIFTLAPDQLVIITCEDLQYGFGVHRQTIINPPGIIYDMHYLRGFARVDGLYIIGVSKFSSSVCRGEGDSLILVLDNELRLVERIVLEDTGQITEIRALDTLDYAHNGLRCPYDKA